MYITLAMHKSKKGLILEVDEILGLELGKLKLDCQ